MSDSRLACSLLVFINLLSWIPRWSGPLDFRWDAAVYYVLGTSIAQGSGYRLLYEPGKIEAIQYPPLLPAIVAGHQKVLGTSDPIITGSALRKTWCVLSSTLVVLTYLLARRFLHPALAFIAGLVCVFHLDGFFLSTLCFADLPFTTVTTAFLLLVTRGRSQWQAGIAAGLAYSLRTAGIAALLTWVAVPLFERRYRAVLLRLALASIPIVAWTSYTRSVEASDAYHNPTYSYQRAGYLFYNVTYATNLSYRDPFAPELGALTITERIGALAVNIAWIPYNTGVTLSNQWTLWSTVFSHAAPASLINPLITPSLAGLGMIALIGIGMLLHRGHRSECLYVALMFLALAATPWRSQSWRYAYPLLPLLTIGFLVTCDVWLKRVPVVFRVTAGSGLVLIQLVFLAAALRWYSHWVTWDAKVPSSQFRAFYYDDKWKHLDQTIQCVRSEQMGPEPLVTSQPAWIYLRTGLTTIMPPFLADPIEAQKLVRSAKALYVLIDRVDGGALTYRYLGEALDSGWERLCESSGGDSFLYRRKSN